MWEKLKIILKETSDKAIIVEDGEPKYVILSVVEYLNMKQLNNKKDKKQQFKSQNQLNTAQERLENSEEHGFTPNLKNQNDVYAQPVVQDFSIDLSDIENNNGIIQDNIPFDINLDDLPI